MRETTHVGDPPRAAPVRRTRSWSPPPASQFAFWPPRPGGRRRPGRRASRVNKFTVMPRAPTESGTTEARMPHLVARALIVARRVSLPNNSPAHTHAGGGRRRGGGAQTGVTADVSNVAAL